MAIVPLQKVTLFGSRQDRDAVLEGLQRLGCLHLLDLSSQAAARPLDQAERNEVAEAISYLAACPIQNPKQRTQYHQEQACLQVARQTLENKRLREELGDQRDQLQRQIEVLEPWGEFRLPDLSETGGQRLWFYAIPHHEVELVERSARVWQRIHQDRQFTYVVVVQREEPELPWSNTDLAHRPLSELRQELESLQEELETLHWQRVELTRWSNLLQRDLTQTDDWLERVAAAERTWADGQVFALQAWVPKIAMPALREFARPYRLAMTFRDPQPDEHPPTLLKNPRAVAGAEDAVTFYITPSYKAWDPTWIMFISFTVFFAMIVSDAAYGLVFGIGLLFLWKRLSGSDNLRRLRNLLLAMVVATVAYGVATGSYFGTTPDRLAWLQLKVEGQPLLTHKDAMMMLSLGIGVFHLCLANLITAWQQRGRGQALAAVGWAVGILGGYLLGLFSQETNKAAVWLAETWGRDVASFQPLLKQVGQVGLFGGLAMIFLFSSSRPLWSRKPADWGWRMIDGLLGLTNVTKAFGDTLSYLRLFALGFASAQLAVTFNNMAAGMQTVPGVGMLLAILVLILGHTVNMVLGIMGGVVHGLRLNCIEFFNWSLTEEGHPFRAFSKKAT